MSVTTITGPTSDDPLEELLSVRLESSGIDRISCDSKEAA